VTQEPFKQHLKAARPFGCLTAVLLGVGMVFVVYLGSVLGDCVPNTACHNRDGSHILNGFLWTLVIVALIGAASWFASAILRMALRPLIGAIPTNLVLIVASLLTAWFGFGPAIELLLKVI
jgi:hypothetical protein